MHLRRSIPFQCLIHIYINVQVNAWDMGSFTPACKLEPAAGSRVRSIAASADGATAVVVLFDSSIGVWDLQRGVCTRVLQKRGQWHLPQVHSGGINAAYLSPDSSHVLTISKVRTALLAGMMPLGQLQV